MHAGSDERDTVMNAQREIYARVKDRPDYVKARHDAEAAHARIYQAAAQGDIEAMMAAQADMAGANIVITRIYDTVSRARRNEGTE